MRQQWRNGAAVLMAAAVTAVYLAIPLLTPPGFGLQDVSCFRVGADLLAAGQDPYNLAAFTHAWIHDGFGIMAERSFSYPPTALALMWLFHGVDPWWIRVIVAWTTTGLCAAAVAAVWRTLKAAALAPSTAAFLAAAAAGSLACAYFQSALMGSPGMAVFCAGVLGIWILLRGRSPALFAAAVFISLIKPQECALAIAFVMLMRPRLRYFAAAAIALAAALIVPVAAFHAWSWPGWIQSLQQYSLGASNSLETSMTGIGWILALARSGPGPLPALGVVLVLAAMLTAALAHLKSVGAGTAAGTYFILVYALLFNALLAPLHDYDNISRMILVLLFLSLHSRPRLLYPLLILATASFTFTGFRIVLGIDAAAFGTSLTALMLTVFLFFASLNKIRPV